MIKNGKGDWAELCSVGTLNFIDLVQGDASHEAIGPVMHCSHKA